MVLPQKPADLYRQSTDVAGICREIVLKTAVTIQDRKYVRCEGWLAIATAHGCVVSTRDVEKIEGGYRAIGEVRKISDGVTVATAEGFVGIDEPVWFGGDVEITGRNGKFTKHYTKRPDYAIRAMAQTRAISRVCRAAFAHVVVLMDAGLQTTPAEEVPDGGFNDHSHAPVQKPAETTAGKPAAPQASPQIRQTAKPATEQKPYVRTPEDNEADCLLIDFNEAFSKEGAATPWHLFICKFKDESGQEMEASTFDEKIGNQLKSMLNTTVTITFKPNLKKLGKFILTSIQPHEVIP